ncbi:tetratricopeptide repeat protein [Clostridium tertium]|uniref:Tetratricopeptide repeat protein n=1 Tax=Clostridium tertium TaxID=1559 RepID=A0A6N3CP30_9CLOT
MKNKENKTYEKALNLYNNGYIDKAIDICEQGISRDLSNSKLLNLKGLLLYLRGDLEEAVALFKTNRHFNNDDISSSYLKDIEKDYERLNLYNRAVECINKFKIDEAIELLDLCRESDFNSINVNKYLAICYLRKGDYLKSHENLSKLIEIDKVNVEAKEIKKELNNALEIKDSSLLKKIIPVALLIIISIFIAIFIKDKVSNKYNEDNIKAEEVQNNIEDNNSHDENNSNQTNEENINNEEVNNENREETSEKEDKGQEIEVLTEEEIKESYIKASSYYEDNNIEEAKVVLEKVLPSAEKSHLRDDIMFLLASAYENLNYVDKAINYYDAYIEEYEGGSYIQEAYYRAALIYKDRNNEKSKTYALKLKDNYPNSIYNNSKIQEIISS